MIRTPAHRKMGIAKINTIISVLLFFCWHFACAQINPCVAAANCGICTDIADCVWCSQPDLTEGRCMMRNEARCNRAFIMDAKVSIELLKDEPLTQQRTSDDPIQLRPQHVSMTNVRKGKIYNIPIEFKQAKDYPIDLYFLMDLSNSMKDDKENLERLSSKLALTMKNITKYFSLGFGSFVDKHVFPFSWTGPGAQKTYAFKNHMPLADNVARFTNEVKFAAITPTYDLPEGGLEALVQVMVCVNQTGWRKKARHIVILATDDYSHLAGNGKLGGVLRPNDGECHLNAAGTEYTHGLLQDYPSLGQINKIAQEHSMNIIFAVTESVAEPYEMFRPLVKGSTVGILKPDASNIVGLVEEQYQLITSSVELSNTPVDGTKIRYFTRCLEKQGSPLKENATCGGLKVGSLVNYTISIEVTECPVGKTSHNQRIVVSPVGLTDELVIDLQIECDCPCERADAVSCPSQCDEISKCIECNKYISDSNSIQLDQCLLHADRCNALNLTKRRETSPKLNPMRECQINDVATECRRNFFYGYDENGQKQVFYDSITCVALPLANIAFSVMGALIGIGLAMLLLWRLLIFLYDRKEYAKFLEDAKSARWNTENNPLYVQASTNFSNPAFQQQN